MASFASTDKIRANPETALGVYLSVPFCRAKCSFCNFASGVSDAAAIERYVVHLCEEMAAARTLAASLHAELPDRIATVYFGGGTPSLLTPPQLAQIFGTLRDHFALDDDAEITLEAAPGQIAPDTLEAAQRLGVNRISLGVQSFVDRECQAVGRAHTGTSCCAEIRRLRAVGIASVGADLIAGLPYQTAASWQQSLAAAAMLAAEGSLAHLSVYMLEVDGDSRLGREVLNGGARLHAPAVPSDDASAAMYEVACAVLPAAGLVQYEISNFAAESHRSRHNLKYWQRSPYLGFGLDAHSMLATAEGSVRFANPDSLEAHVGAASERTITPVRQREAFEETVFLGLRLNDGLTLDGWPRDWIACFDDAARQLAREGLMTHRDSRWALTLHGCMVSNEVFGNLLDAVPV